MSSTVSTVVELRSGRRFGRHALEMAVAMVLGTVVYAVVVGLAAGTVENARLGQPELYAFGMAAAMSVPMVAWMRRRGHGWGASTEMTVAMFLPFAVAVACYWLGALHAGTICPVGCATMFPAMLVAMLYRLDEYS